MACNDCFKCLAFEVENLKQQICFVTFRPVTDIVLITVVPIKKRCNWLYARQPGRVLKKLNAWQLENFLDFLRNPPF